MATCLTCGAELETVDSPCSSCSATIEPQPTQAQQQPTDRLSSPPESMDASPFATMPIMDFATDRDVLATPAPPRSTNYVLPKNSRGLLAVFVGAFALFDFLAVPLTAVISTRPDEAIVFLMMVFYFATYIAQVSLLTIWMVFAPLKLVARVAWALGAAVLGISAFFLGVLVVTSGDFGPGAGIYFFIGITYLIGPYPLCLLAAQLGLWIMRFWRHWRIVRVDAAADEAKHKPLRILDVMIATGFVAVALALLQGLKFDGGRQEPLYVLFVLAMAGFTAIYAAALLIPTVWAAMRSPPSLSKAFTAIAIHVAVIVITMLIGALIEGRGGPSGGTWAVFLLTAIIHCAILLSILTAFRRRGYVLRKKGE